MGAIIAMKPFQNTFNTGLTGEKIAIITSLYSVYVPNLSPCEIFTATKIATHC